MKGVTLRRALALAGVVVWASLGAAQAQAQAQPDPATETLAAPCSACHGPRGQSQIPGQPSLAGQPRIFVENTLVLIREGMREVPVMQSFVKGLTDEHISQLAKYYAAMPAKPAPTGLDAAKAARGAVLSQQAGCVSCHRAGYVGFEQVPRLSGQDESYLRDSMKMFRDAPAPGRDSVMINSVRGMSDAQLADLAHYLTHHMGAPANKP